MARRFLVNFGSLSGSRIFTAFSQVIVLPIVARFLDAADFGDVALAMTVTLFAQLLSDAGLGRSLIRRSGVDPAEWSSVFWFLALVGTLLAASLLLIAPFWAGLFDRPSVGPMVMALSPVPWLFALSAVSTAMMERNGRFPRIAALRAVAAGAGIVAVISLALAGAGAWALIAQQLAIAVVQCVGALLLGGFRPMSPRARVPLGDHLGFARDTLGVSVLMTAQRQVPMMMIGYALGAVSLGYYTMSQRIQNLPVNSIAGPFARIAYVQISAAQEDLDRVRGLFLHGMRLLAFAILPPVAWLIGIGETAFVLLLSETWLPVATIFALAAPGIVLETTTSHAGVLFQAMNRTGLRLRMVTERTVLRLLVVAAALPFGLDAVAASITLSAMVFVPRLRMHLNRVISLDMGTMIRPLVAPVAVALVLFAGARWLQATTDGWTTIWLALPLLGTVWGLGGVSMRHSLREGVSALTH